MLCKQHCLSNKGFCLVVLLLSFKLNLLAQSAARAPVKPRSHASNINKIKSLDIGDKVPDVIFDKMLKYSSKTPRLSGFKEELVILDFWATWCTPCIQAMPKLESLQKHFGNRIKILLVNQVKTGDTGKEIKTFFERREIMTGQQLPELPMIIQDSVLSQLFPHSALPHYVWVNKRGVVVAITSSIEVTKENILNLLNGERPKLHTKMDIKGWGPEELEALFDPKGTILYQSIFTGYKEGLSGARTTNVENGISTGIAFFNYPLFALTLQAYQISNVPNNRLILDVKNPIEFKVTYDEDTLKYHYTYCYGIRLPLNANRNLFEYMQNDLKRTFNITLKKEKRRLKCRVLTATTNVNRFFTKGGTLDVQLESETLNKFILNMPAKEVIKLFDSMFEIPLVDETNLEKNLDISLPYNLTDKTALIETLKRAGFSITESERDFEVYVITNKD